jgi:pyruvate kinase
LAPWATLRTYQQSAQLAEMDPFYDTFGLGKKLPDIEEEKEKQWEHRCVKAKVMATIGPATCHLDNIISLLNAGVSIMRVNLSHNTRKWHTDVINRIKQARQLTNKECAILTDLRGAEIRIGYFKSGLKKITITKGQPMTFHLGPSPIDGDTNHLWVDYPNLYKYVTPGSKILVNYGYQVFTVKVVTESEIETVADNDGSLAEHKIVHLLNKDGKKVNTDLPLISAQDKDDIDWAVQNGVDFISATIGTPNEVTELRNLPTLKTSKVKIIIKLDREEGVENFPEILNLVDGIILARTGIAMDLPVEEVAHVQKKIIRKCNFAGKPVIITNQVLHSMITNPRPTRAECTDVVNAILDGVDCFCLTNTTAEGAYPIKTVKMLLKQCKETERTIPYRDVYTAVRQHMVYMNPNLISITESMASSAVKTAWDLDATLLMALSEEPDTVRFVAKYRPHTPIVCLTTSQTTARQSLIHFGVIPFLYSNDGSKSILAIIDEALHKAKDIGLVKKGEHAVVIYGGETSKGLGAPSATIQQEADMFQVFEID